MKILYLSAVSAFLLMFCFCQSCAQKSKVEQGKDEDFSLSAYERNKIIGRGIILEMH